jgi:predicted MFS family arabinose efflux permease
VFFAAAIVALGMAGIAAATLPRIPQTRPLRYRALMLSILHLVRSQPALRRSSLSQGLLFASFNAFWATLALLVEAPPFNLTAAGAGMFGVIGVAGAFVAPLSGRFTDRRGPRPMVVAGALFVVAAFAVLWMGGARSLIAVGLGVLLIDIGLNAALIANQTRVYALVPSARGRINTVLFTVMFVFGALGAFAGSQAFLMAGWSGVCAVGILLAGAGFLVSVLEPRGA